MREELEFAFPRQPHYQRDGNTQHFYTGHYGMTLRDYFAAHSPTPPDNWNRGYHLLNDDRAAKFRAKYAYEYADAMLAEREK